MIRNMKIRSKLFAGFALLLAVLIFVSIFAARQLFTVEERYSQVLNYPVVRQNLLRNIEVSMMDARRTMNRASMYASEVDIDVDGGANEAANAAVRNRGIDSQEAHLASLRARIISYADAFDQSLRNDEAIEPATRNAQIERISTLEGAALHYIDHYIGQTMNYARAGDSLSPILVTRAAMGTVDRFYDTFYEINTAIETHMDAVEDDLGNDTETTFFIVIVLMVAGVVIGVVVALLISGAINKPVARLVSLTDDLAVGRLNMNIDHSAITKDEIGVLTGNMFNVVDVIRNIMQDLNKLNYEFNETGDFEYRADANKYQNSYKEVVEGVNNIVDHSVEDTISILDTLTHIKQGDFNVTVKDLPGKKMILPKTAREVIENLKSVYTDINAMIEAAADKGDLEFQLDEKKYEGDWRKIIAGLNHIAEAVDLPIVEIRDVMSNLSQGDFSKKITGDYAGDFLKIKNAMNGTIDILAAYISEISQTLTAVSGGDLTLAIKRDYVGNFAEIKNSINNIASTLRKAMGEIASASKYVLEGANKITSNAMELADGSSTQAASLEELNTSVELIKVQTRQFADNASEANGLSNKSTQNAQQGNEAMKQMLGAMMQIKDSSNNISKIIRVIQDIAFQTNLLSLNAAVEAARAGEHGKGFGVVAEEVRSLAARSQDAAAETTALIQDSISRVESGASIAQVTSESLDTIVTNATEVLSLINNITTAANEQADMIAQISTTLLYTATTVQNNSKFAHEAAATAEELNSQSEMLQQLVSYFRL